MTDLREMFDDVTELNSCLSVDATIIEQPLIEDLFIVQSGLLRVHSNDDRSVGEYRMKLEASDTCRHMSLPTIAITVSVLS